MGPYDSFFPPSATERWRARDGASQCVRRWDVKPGRRVRGVLLVAHGMAEHALRYGRFADALTDTSRVYGDTQSDSFIVYAYDHRGHGYTAPSTADLGIFAEHDGWQRLVDDMHDVRTMIGTRHPELPVALFAHSMGSLVARDYLSQHGDTLTACVLSGTSGGNAAVARAGAAVARALRCGRLRARRRSWVMQFLSFGSYNRKFRPARTKFDWLSSDQAEVDKYIKDDRCGFALRLQAWIDVLSGVQRVEDIGNIRRIPEALPILLVSGAFDPVGNATRGVEKLVAAFAAAGLRGVEPPRFYRDGRHELLNEVAPLRDQVTRDVIDFLLRVMPARTP